uniref:Uncharacterized protein n=1 Tax=Anopheles atroparvus TaxID=41427 RepID=A0A182J0Z0_ANOAO
MAGLHRPDRLVVVAAEVASAAVSAAGARNSLVLIHLQQYGGTPPAGQLGGGGGGGLVGGGVGGGGTSKAVHLPQDSLVDALAVVVEVEERSSLARIPRSCSNMVALHRPGNLVDALVAVVDALERHNSVLQRINKPVNNHNRYGFQICQGTNRLLHSCTVEGIHFPCRGLAVVEVVALVEVLVEVEHSSWGQFLHSYNSTVEHHRMGTMVDVSVEEVAALAVGSAVEARE